MKNSDINAFLGKGIVFEGKLNFDGTVRIDGHFKGEITSAEGVLIIGEYGIIEADVNVSYVIVSGEVRGNIRALHKIDINPSGKVFGDITSPGFVIQEGAVFEGGVQMPSSKEKVKKNVNLTAPIDLEEPIEEVPEELGTIRGVVLADPPRPDGSIDDILSAREEKRKGDPIKNAKVIAVCRGIGKKRTKTDDTGFYEFTDLKSGLWKLELKARGYEAEQTTVEVSAGGVYEVNFD